MMNKNRTIEEVFSQVRQAELKPLHSIQQIEAILSADNAPQYQRNASSSIRKKTSMGIALFIAVAGVIGGILWLRNGKELEQIRSKSQELIFLNHLPNTEGRADTSRSKVESNHLSIAKQPLQKSNKKDDQRTVVKNILKNDASNIPNLTPSVSRVDNSSVPDSFLISLNKSNECKSTNQDSIQGIQKIQLNQKELKEIGILFDGHKLFIKTEDKYENHLVISTTSIDSNDYYNEGTEIQGTPSSNITPIIVVSHWNLDSNKFKSFLQFPDKSPILESLSISKKELESEAMKFNNLSDPSIEHKLPKLTNGYPKLSKLIPIYIRLGSEIVESTNKKYGADVYLWYYPTPEFVSALPDRYRIPLQQELDAITDVVECQMPVGQVCERLTGEKTFFDFCRKSSGAIATVQAYPNPASQQITCRYQLTNQRLVTITLHELSGKFLRELKAEQSVTAGIHEVPLQLGDITPGAYLIAVKTDTGDQAVQRIIVQQ